MKISNLWIAMTSIIIMLISIAIAWTLFSLEHTVDNEKCIDVNRIAGFVYDICYDSYTNNILMLVKRNSEDYSLASFNVSFSDIKEKSYNLRYNVINDSQLYKFYAEINPQIVYVSLNVIGNFSEPICKRPRELPVRYCLTKSPGWGKGSLNGSVVEDYILLEDFKREEYHDSFNLSKKETSDVNLSKKEIVWNSLCESNWECSEWESCEEGLQKRNCKDKNNCLIPTYIPETVKYCDLECIESWECDWSDCVDGFTTPTCRDKNECGSLYVLPPKVSCSFERECRPFIQCNEWSSCEVDYNLFDLSRSHIDYAIGVKSRICRDLSFCVEPIEQIKNCSVGIDIYTRQFTKCGIEFIGIYNLLNDKLIARIDKGTKNNSILNIYLDDDDNFYCDYCFNGIKDSEEEGIDCGGSCEKCSDKYQKTTFRKKTWWNNLNDWIKKI